jgi:hypothetical protein
MGDEDAGPAVEEAGVDSAVEDDFGSMATPKRTCNRRRESLVLSLEKKGNIMSVADLSEHAQTEELTAVLVAQLTESEMALIREYATKLALAGVSEESSFDLAMNSYLAGIIRAHEIAPLETTSTAPNLAGFQAEDVDETKDESETLAARDEQLVSLYAEQMSKETCIDEAVAYGVALDTYLADRAGFRSRMERWSAVCPPHETHDMPAEDDEIEPTTVDDEITVCARLSLDNTRPVEFAPATEEEEVAENVLEVTEVLTGFVDVPMLVEASEQLFGAESASEPAAESEQMLEVATTECAAPADVHFTKIDSEVEPAPKRGRKGRVTQKQNPTNEILPVEVDIPVACAAPPAPITTAVVDEPAGPSKRGKRKAAQKDEPVQITPEVNADAAATSAPIVDAEEVNTVADIEPATITKRGERMVATKETPVKKAQPAEAELEAVSEVVVEPAKRGNRNAVSQMPNEVVHAAVESEVTNSAAVVVESEGPAKRGKRKVIVAVQEEPAEEVSSAVFEVKVTEIAPIASRSRRGAAPEPVLENVEPATGMTKPTRGKTAAPAPKRGKAAKQNEDPEEEIATAILCDR